MKTLYTATAIAEGGRSGHVSVDDGPIDLDLSVPKSMGGDGGDGTNPEQLFGSAYAPGVDQETGEDLINSAHEICPFSKATRDNIDVELNLLMDE